MDRIMYIGMFLLSILIASASQIVLKQGAKEKNIYINRYTIIGYTLMLLSTICTLIGYKGVELNFSGVLQALSFVLVPIFSLLILKEKINKHTTIGICLIILGIVIYSI